jgi:hypothetical protein
MRSHVTTSILFLIPTSLVTAACASSPPEAPAAAATVRERLTQPTRLLVAAGASTGSLTASHYTSGGWQAGTTAVTIQNGELDASAGSAGNLDVAALSLDLGPIEIPSSVFGKPATLKDVRLRLAAPPAVTTSWTDADDATASAQVALDLDWTIVVDGNGSPLGTQHLPAIPVAIALVGSGAEVDATIDVHATGELWSWADLLKITELDLKLAATSSF